MRRNFFPAFLGAGLALALLVAATPADAQMHMKSKEEREAAEQKRKKAREDAQAVQAQAQTTAAAPVMTQPPPASTAVCNPDVAAKPGVNTFEDILAMAGFGLGDLATAAAPAQDTAVVEWQPVVPEPTEQ